MKKILLTSLFGLLLLSLFGAHTRSIDLTYHHVPSTSKYIFRVTEFMDVLPPQLAVGDTLHYRIHNQSNSDSYASHIISINQISNACVPLLPAVVVYETDTIDLGPIPPSGYRFYTESCCRANGIVNIVNSSAAGFRIDVEMIPEPGTSFARSSAHFVNPPTQIWTNSSLILVSQTAISPANDSVFYELIPLNGGGFGSVVYASGYTHTNPFGQSIPVSIDQRTGTITATGASVGMWAVNLQVSSYRNGHLTSRIHRDFMVIGNTNPPDAPSITLKNAYSTGGALMNQNGTYTVTLAPDDSIYFHAEATVNGSDSISLNASSDLLANGNGTTGNCLSNCASFNPVNAFKGISTVTGAFSFMADTSHLNNGAANGFDVWFNAAAKDSCQLPLYTNTLVSFVVDPAYGIGFNEETRSQVKIYPKPTDGQVTIQFEQTSHEPVKVFDLNGVCVFRQEIHGSNTRLDLSGFPAGVYTVKLGSYIPKIDLVLGYIEINGLAINA